MAVLEIAVDIGTSNTSIFVSGNGVVLREPTAIAFSGGPQRGKIRAVGKAAYEMLGKAPEKTTVVSPVTDGVISDPEACGQMLREFVKKILPDSFVFFPRIRAILGVPTGLTVEERRMYEGVVRSAFVREVTMVENIILSGVGADIPFNTATGGLVVNIGGGITEIAALALSGVISACGVTIGGNLMDKALIDRIAGRYNLKIGLLGARKIKTEIGTLFENDISYADAHGIDLSTKTLSSARVKASDVTAVLRPYYMRVRDAVESVVNMLPPEIAADVYKSGVCVAGGAAAITGLSEFLSAELSLNAHIPDDPEYAAISGAGKLLSNPDLLDEIMSQK
ncbi:MAG: rod shape-determining protein [Clostridiales bacterium]|jgi:rod shape-determining protein MreB|nr:rod shape-determining protein [Clostridiales bacterium]